MVLLVAAPLVVSRTSDDVSWHSVVYYLGAYAAGMVIGTHYEAALSLFRRYSVALLLIAAVTTYAILQTYLRNFEWIGFVSIRESLLYVQKLSLAALVLIFLHRYEERLPQWLMTVATYAFPIYFLHAFFIIALAEAQRALGLAPAEDNAAGLILGGAALLVGSIAVSLALSRLAQGLLGSRARALIGA
jgi:membrane-bound acyltransferase YfiQ involved in biofilm formation